MWRRPSPIASAMPFRYGASSTPSSPGPGSRSPATSARVTLRLGVLLLGVLQVAGGSEIWVIDHRIEAGLHRGSGLTDQLVGPFELASMHGTDGVRARTDRPPGGGKRVLTSDDDAHRNGNAGRR